MELLAIWKQYMILVSILAPILIFTILNAPNCICVLSILVSKSTQKTLMKEKHLL